MNKKIAENRTEEKKIGLRGKAYNILKKNHVRIICFMMMALIAYVQITKYDVFASGGTADTLWTTITNLIKTWVTRLGGVVMFVGGVMFGLGWKSDDAEQKSRGVSTIIAGAIVIAVAAVTSTFFK